MRRLRLHDRFVHGAGVVCGLHVYAAPRKLHPWSVGICPGYAVTPCGDEIDVPVRVVVDIRDFLWSRPVVDGIDARVAFVGLRYADDAGPLSAAAESCGCGCTSHADAASEYLHEGYAIEILWKYDRTRVTFDLCLAGTAPCPSTPTTPHVVIAAVRLPVLESTPLTNGNIVQL